MQEDLAAAERARKNVEHERDELMEELTSGTTSRSALSDEKRRLDSRISELEEELEEERAQNEMLMEKAKRTQLQADQSHNELNTERSNSQRSENQRVSLERQNKDLKTKLPELESELRSKTRGIITNLEAKVATLEKQLNVESSDRANLAKNLRKSDKKVRELTLQIEEERRHGDQYKEQYDKTSQKLRQTKRQLD